MGGLVSSEVSGVAKKWYFWIWSNSQTRRYYRDLEFCIRIWIYTPALSENVPMKPVGSPVDFPSEEQKMLSNAQKIPYAPTCILLKNWLKHLWTAWVSNSLRPSNPIGPDISLHSEPFEHHLLKVYGGIHTWGYPKNGWSISWKLQSRNGWWTGVPPWRAGNTNNKIIAGPFKFKVSGRTWPCNLGTSAKAPHRCSLDQSVILWVNYNISLTSKNKTSEAIDPDDWVSWC